MLHFVGTESRQVNLGYDLAAALRVNSWPTRQALVALALYVGGFGLTQRQAAKLVGANLTYVVALARLSPEQRRQIARGIIKLSHFINHRRTGGCPGLVELLQQAAPHELADAASQLGVDRVWDTMVMPLIREAPSSMSEAAE